MPPQLLIFLLLHIHAPVQDAARSARVSVTAATAPAAAAAPPAAKSTSAMRPAIAVRPRPWPGPPVAMWPAMESAVPPVAVRPPVATVVRAIGASRHETAYETPCKTPATATVVCAIAPAVARAIATTVGHAVSAAAVPATVVLRPWRAAVAAAVVVRPTAVKEAAFDLTHDCTLQMAHEPVCRRAALLRLEPSRCGAGQLARASTFDTWRALLCTRLCFGGAGGGVAWRRFGVLRQVRVRVFVPTILGLGCVQM